MLVNTLADIFSSLYIFGWIYDTDKKDNRIKELETQLNSFNKLDLSKEYIKEDLASIMHSIWAVDIINNSSNSTQSELERARLSYDSLNELDKEVNRKKADEIIYYLESYI